MSDCLVCTSPAGDTNLCRSCTDRLKIDLRAVPDLAADLEITLSRQDAVSPPNGPRATTAPLAYKPRASESLFTLRHTLGAWSVDIADRRDVDLDLRTTVDMSQFLLRHLHTIRIHHNAGQMVDEVDYAISEARKAIDTPLDRRVFVGPCDLRTADEDDTDDDHRCREPLYAQPWQDTITCPVCSSEWDVAERRAWLLANVEDEVQTIPTLVSLIVSLLPREQAEGINVNAVQNLARSGRLRWVSMDSHKRRRYRVRDVLNHFLGQRQAAS